MNQRPDEQLDSRIAGWSESTDSPAELLRSEARHYATPAAAGRAAEPPAAARTAAPLGSDVARSAATIVEPRVVPRPDQVTVDLGDQFGDVGRLRLSIKGPSLRATIVPSDASLASRLDAGLQDLTQSLRDRGFADSRVTVRTPVVETAITPVPTGREGVALGRQPEIGTGAAPERGPSGGRQDPEQQEPGQRHGQRRQRPGSERQQRGRWA